MVNSAFGVLVVAYTAAARLPIRRAAVATAAVWAPAVALIPFTVEIDDAPFKLPSLYLVVFNLLTALVCFFIGRTVHNRRRYTAALEERARTAELNQAALTAQAVAEERRRIARELHDVVAHHVSVMSVLATGSRRMLNRDPKAADEALATIEETGRTALREMRRLLSVLRADTEPAGELAPQPGLAGVTNLVEQVREAGLPVTLRVDGQPGPMDPGVALTVYRIVQEALTNALKHAGSATAEVRLSFGTQALEVEVCDTGRGPQLGSAAIGHGLLGMRERVMLYGGTLRTGPRPGGGYRLSAKIPVEALDGAGTPFVERVRETETA
jgi:signal transduction histidine kinase